MRDKRRAVTKAVSLAGLAMLATGWLGAGEYRATSEPGAHEVAVLTGEWVDHNRGDREVPWKIYYPMDAGAPVPVVVWSHGGGGSRDGAEYLGRFLASHGYAAVHIQHHGSDIDVLRRAGGRDGLLSALQGNQEATVQRLKDVPFAVDQLEAMNRSGPLAGKLDTTRMGISGHSFGAITTLAVAGQGTRGYGQRFAVPAFKAAFAMSPSPPGTAPRPRRPSAACWCRSSTSPAPPTAAPSKTSSLGPGRSPSTPTPASTST